jgi:hypothetical protein
MKSYENFKKGFADQPDGFPVREWALLTPSQVANMHTMQTYTIEQVAGWNEQAMAMYGMGARELREKAKLWLASGDQKAEQLSAQAIEIATLKEQLAALVKKVNAADEDNEGKPRRGRPPAQ